MLKRFNKTDNPGGLTAIFCTYQSVQVIADAQSLGLPAFDLIVCDEAHRTTGARQITKSAAEQSAYTKIHDNSIVQATKRLYMTATPRLYGDKLVKAAREESYIISSMDDVAVFGPEFFHLSFGQAVDEGLLTDYKVIALKVSEDWVSADFQKAMDLEEGGFKIPEVAKIIGCIKGLAFQDGEQQANYNPLRNAVAFHNTIAESQRFAEQFSAVAKAYREKTGGYYGLNCETDHVSGIMRSTERRSKLKWLAEDTSHADTDICRILSNARCLAEGVDVPSLEAIIFMKPRKSQIDIVQAVGRVMRRSEGKKYGYIILPVVIPAGFDAEEALDNSDAFSVVWQVLKGLRSHDERLDARINALRFENSSNPPVKMIDVAVPSQVDTDDDGNDKPDISPEQLKFDLQSAVNAAVVRRCGTRVYWEDWADDISKIALAQIKRIRDIINTLPAVDQYFEGFLTGLRDSLNPGITSDDAIEMLAQHIITLPVFEALFQGAGFASSNPVSIAMGGMLAKLADFGLNTPEENLELRELYRSVELRAASIQTDAGRQKVIKELYEGFFSKAFKATSERMGIVYTPNEVVDYILHATDRMLKAEFGQSLEDEGVHILDPFTGTGTFIVNLIQSKLISDAKLPYKYANELHANELMLLAYYIATINIEHAYHSRISTEYLPFPGAVLTDTFQMSEDNDTIDIEVFVENSERMLTQIGKPITVIVGNPPYSSGQNSANDNNANMSYPSLDAKIRKSYVERSKATLNNSVYDSYIRAIRWATDRIGERGIVCYVSNAGWLDGTAMDGMRKSLAEEFSSIYVFNLRGNQRTQGEESRREGGKIFGSGSRAPIAITMWVKNPDSPERGVIHYHDIGDYLSREDKLLIIRRYTSSDAEPVPWKTLTPDNFGDWLNQRDDSFYQFAPMGLEKTPKKPSGLFEIWSRGVATSRDAWTYSYSSSAVENNMSRMINTYNNELARWIKAAKPDDIDAFTTNDGARIKWTGELREDFAREKEASFQPDSIRLSVYRPFCKQWLYMNRQMNNRVYLQPSLFPTSKQSNLAIVVTGVGSSEFSVLSMDITPCLDSLEKSQCFPLYWYEDQKPLGGLFTETESKKYVRHDAITDEALSVFQQTYSNKKITKEEIFYYIYGILHSPEYRERFSVNLNKELPRIPFSADFKGFMKSGRALADLHLKYESVRPYPLEEVGDSENPGRVTKMHWGKRAGTEDKSTIVYNENLTLTGIPEAAHRYVVNGKTALAWLIDRYRVTTDKASGIVNDPNDYSEDPRYIIDLIKRVTRVSIETMEIVDTLEAIQELPQPTYWPEAWRLG